MTDTFVAVLINVLNCQMTLPQISIMVRTDNDSDNLTLQGQVYWNTWQLSPFYFITKSVFTTLENYLHEGIEKIILKNCLEALEFITVKMSERI